MEFREHILSSSRESWGAVVEPWGTILSYEILNWESSILDRSHRHCSLFRPELPPEGGDYVTSSVQPTFKWIPNILTRRCWPAQTWGWGLSCHGARCLWNCIFSTGWHLTFNVTCYSSRHIQEFNQGIIECLGKGFAVVNNKFIVS